MTELMDRLCFESGLKEQDVRRIVATAPRRYKVYNIPKRNGGAREIAQPARELKVLQRILLRSYLYGLRVHQAATAYEPGLSIRKNALAHAGSGPILKMDFRDFFPSIRASDWVGYCRREGLFGDADDLDAVTNLLFRKAKGERTLKLSIGAPTSPHVSNLLMFEFDTLVASEAEKRAIRYTRYADDLTFSGQRIGMLSDMIKLVADASRRIQVPRRLLINEEKTLFITAARRRSVTGLVLGNDGSVGIPRPEKRLIRAKLHRAQYGRLSRAELQKLCGFLAFAKDSDPDFLLSLTRTYGDALITSVQAVVEPHKL